MTYVDEMTLGVTPANPRMRACRFTGETLAYQPVFVNSDEIRDDRMSSDPIKVNETNGGPVNGELSFPVDGSPLSSWFRSLFCAEWVNTPLRDNDGVADSVITGVADTTDVVTVVAGPAFVAGQLVRFTGFGAASNNGLFLCTTGSDTVPTFLGAGFTAEAAPAASARMKVVGIQGAAGDLETVADGIASTAIDLRNFGLTPGRWIKIGGAADATTFAFLVAAGAVARRSAWARVTAVAQNKITLDNIPAGWAVDDGAGKTIQLFVGDQIKNGVATFGGTIERGFMGQQVPTYIVQSGMVVGQAQFNFVTEDKATYSFTFTGLRGSQSTVSLDPTPDPATTNRVMAAGVDVGRIAENGVCLSKPNWMQSLQVTVNNNLRPIAGLTCGEEVGPVDIGKGEFMVTLNTPTYFGSNELLAKLFSQTPTNINTRIAKDNQALVFGFPRITFTDGAPSAGGKNQDVLLPLVGSASKDELTSAHMICDRFEYYV
jgi:hypothetical protein